MYNLCIILLQTLLKVVLNCKNVYMKFKEIHTYLNSKFYYNKFLLKHYFTQIFKNHFKLNKVLLKLLNKILLHC